MLALVATGCGGGSDAPTAAHSPTTAQASTPDTAHPVGIVAIGHSGLTGENSDPSQAGLPAPENSWATGTTPRVDSVYARLVAALPQTRGHVANAAEGGAPVTALAGQLSTALATVPHPALVIVQTIDDDIRCDGTDSANLAHFGATLAGVLTSLTASSPASKILLVGQLGRPSPSFIGHLVTVHPEAKASMTGSGICDFYDPHGKLNPKAFTALTKVIDGYESEQARVCARYAQCHTDGGVRATYQDSLANFTDDLNHLNLRGQAQEAALIWPVVAHILALT
jgi:hypothetical protein